MLRPSLNMLFEELDPRDNEPLFAEVSIETPSKLLSPFQFTEEQREFSRKAVNKIKKEILRPLVLSTFIKVRVFNEKHFSKSASEFSCTDLYEANPCLVKRLLHSLNLNQSGLEKVKEATMRQNWIAACESLVEYYQSESICNRFSIWASSCKAIENLPAEEILLDTFTFQGQTLQISRLTDGCLDWACRGISHDLEWAYFLNRHYHLVNLLTAYRQTSNSDYLKCINDHLLDWIVASGSKLSHWWAQWRGREVALRTVHWAYVFYSLRSHNELAPGIRILMLYSLLEHVRFLRHLHSWGGNWLCREMSGLATIALCWPEFKGASNWLTYARNHLDRELQRQVYPDGVHKELSSHYHRVALIDFQHFADMLETSGEHVPEAYTRRLEQMWSYLAYSINPGGYGVLNNDSDLDFNRPIVQSAAVRYERPDWTYIATNGRVGKCPKGLSSILFPWAGQFIFRNGWDAEAHWSFFDVGSFGIHYHSHYDRLHLSITAYGRNLLVDSGRYCYRRDRFWKYFRQSASHNVILVDGKGQRANRRQLSAPITQDYSMTTDSNFAQGIFDSGFNGIQGKATHSRAVLYLQNQYWVVVDYICTDRPRKIETLWHFHPECTVEAQEQSVVTTDPNVGNLRITPASTCAWTVDLVSGQMEPVQGWWSREYNHLVPNPTAIYSTQISKSSVFVWILYPKKGLVPKVQADLVFNTTDCLNLIVSVSGGKTDKFLIRWEDLSLHCSLLRDC